MKFEKSEKEGAAPTLAIFMILIIISSALVIVHLQTIGERKVSSIQLLMSSDATRSALSSINSDLEGTLEGSLPAAMHYAGQRGGTVENVENYIITYLHNRIEKGWDYPNMKENVPLVHENSIKFQWQPNGSLLVTLKLDTEIKHVKGPSAYGTYIRASTFVRFQRLKYLNEKLNAETPNHMSNAEMDELEKDLNKKYETEGFLIDLYKEDSRVWVAVSDTYGGMVAITD